MVEITRLVGQKIIVVLKETAMSSKTISGTFQGENVFVADLAGVDFIGIWVALPDVILVKIKDKDGNPLPEQARINEQVVEHFLIKWEYVEAISAFPEQEKEIVYYKKEIGFNRQKKKL